MCRECNCINFARNYREIVQILYISKDPVANNLIVLITCDCQTFKFCFGAKKFSGLTAAARM